MAINHWVSFPEVNKEEYGIEIGPTGLPIPLEDDQLQLNVGSLSKSLIDYAGFAEVRLGEQHLYQEDIAYSVSSVNLDGSATGSAARASRRSRSNRESIFSDNEKLRLFRTGTSKISWSSSAIQEELEGRDKTSASAWAYHIGREIKLQAVKSSHDAAKTGLESGYFSTAMMAFDAIFLGDVGAEAWNGQYGEMTDSFAIKMTALALIRLIETKRNGVNWGESIRDPLFWTYRGTRAAGAVGLLAVSRLVRETPNQVYSVSI